MAVLETKKIGLGKLPQILPKQWLEIGIGLLDRIKKDTQSGLSQDDGEPTFRGYSKSYKAFKKRGKPLMGRATDSQINPANLKYTGEMLKTIWIKRPHRSGFTIQYKEGQKVLWNKWDERNIFDINSRNMDWIANEVVKVFDKNAKKLKNVKLKIGK